MPLWNPYDVSADIATHAALATVHHTPPVVTTGTYTGNNSANRAIAHGLPGRPSLILIGETNIVSRNRILGTEAGIQFDWTTQSVFFAVTQPDATNFYVGNATQYTQSANATGINYHWTAYP